MTVTAVEAVAKALDLYLDEDIRRRNGDGYFTRQFISVLESQGFCIAPVEATEKMIDAAEGGHRDDGRLWRESNRGTYKAMIAARDE